VVVRDGLGFVGVKAGRVDGVRGGERDLYLNRLKTCGGSGGITSTFVISAVVRGEQLASHFGRFPLSRRLCVHIRVDQFISAIS
jgi:hypothetical protein